MKSKRLISLDVFRGMCVAGMIFVNHPGIWDRVLPPLLHAQWHGWTPTDLIFPFFLFIVGISLVFSLSQRIATGDSQGRMIVKILSRALVLFALGLLLYLIPLFQFSRLRVAGVLQRIAICYAVAAILYLKLKKRGLIMTTAILLIGYWLAMRLVPVPGIGAGQWTPEGNLAGWLDRIILKGTVLYQGTWDPEGFLSTFPAIATTLLGVLWGIFLRTPLSWKIKSLISLIAGVGGIVIGSLWGMVFPINKNLWTSSYVLFTAGWALLLLAPLVYFCEERGRQRWAKPFVIFGINPITAYFLSSALLHILWQIDIQSGNAVISLHAWLYQHLFASWAGPLAGSLLFATVFLLIWLGVMALFYRRKIFIRV